MNRFFPEIKGKLGFGLMRLPMIDDKVDFEQTSRMVDSFLEAGLNYFDTAHPYIQGQSEEAVAKCLSSRYPREKYLLANKLTPRMFQTKDEVLPLIELQLKTCGVEYFDFFLMHAMDKNSYQSFKEMGIFPMMQRLKEQGRLRHVGMSFHDTADVLDMILTEQPQLEFVQLQFNYADYNDPKVQSRACYDVCVKHGKPVMVMEPVKGGSLADLPADVKAMMPSGSPASYAVRFAASHEQVAVVLSGMSNTEQMEDNLSYMKDFKPLTEAETETIDRVRTVYQALHKVPCTACRYCTDGCPAGIPIPDVFACMNRLAAGEGDPKADYAALDVKADACVGCGQCEEACPQHLHIPQLLKEAVKKFSE